MQDNLDEDNAKMGAGVMRFSSNPVVCIIDSNYAGRTVRDAGHPFDFPVTGSVAEAAGLGADVLVLGIAPSGGRIPADWYATLDEAVSLGMCLVNGLHDELAPRYARRLKNTQWVWDVRQLTSTPPIATAQAATLQNKRVLLIGTDMAIGKMTAGLEVYRWVKDHRPDLATEFLATGQIGITITGRGIPLDACKVDHACGAVEQMVMESADKDIVFIEGQGSLLHPGSTATLPLMRGSCATHLILCHRARMTHLRKPIHIEIPDINSFIRLNEDVAVACGSLTPAKVIAIALNTSRIDSTREARKAISDLEQETNLLVDDPVRFGAEKLAQPLLPEHAD